MKRTRWLAVAILALAVVVGVVGLSSREPGTQAAPEPPANTMQVSRGPLSAMVSLDGTLTYRARPDGSPYSVINQALGRYTELPDDGDQVTCGNVLYRVDNRPVLLLCGTVPVYRDLHYGYVGTDVGQLNRNLHTLGYDARAGVDINPDDTTFTWMTDRALKALQYATGANVTGELYVDDAIFLPEPVRIARVTGELGASAQPGAPVLSATSDTLHVQVDLNASQQGQVKAGDPARITLPSNTSVTGRVDRFGRVAQAADGQTNTKPTAATIAAYISLDDPTTSRGLDKAPVRVDITTAGVENALSVPVIALVGKSGGGFAVEVVRAGGTRELVAVKLGLFDTTGGRVQVFEGDLRDGDQVVVPSP